MFMGVSFSSASVAVPCTTRSGGRVPPRAPSMHGGPGEGRRTLGGTPSRAGPCGAGWRQGPASSRRAARGSVRSGRRRPRAPGFGSESRRGCSWLSVLAPGRITPVDDDYGRQPILSGRAQCRPLFHVCENSHCQHLLHHVVTESIVRVGLDVRYEVIPNVRLVVVFHCLALIAHFNEGPGKSASAICRPTSAA